MQNYKTLYRSRTSTVIGGVSGGLGRYFNIDPVLFRILFVVLTFLAAGGILLYIILWIVMPLEPFGYPNEDAYFRPESKANDDAQSPYRRTGDSAFPQDFKKPKNDGGLVVGIILITLGGIFLISHLIPRIHFGDIWPIVLIVAGLVIIGTSFRSDKKNQ